MTTKEKLRLIRLEMTERELKGYGYSLADSGRLLKAQVYADVLKRHPNAIRRGYMPRIIAAVSTLIRQPSTLNSK